jgi:hypothetical protein
LSDAKLEDVVSAFGASTKAKLANKAAIGAPEDQLRGPLETLIRDLALLAGLPKGVVTLVGESTLSELATRPDYAVTVQNALVGFIEVKAPGKGADPRRFTDAHDKKQWAKLKSLPNILYTDGNAFSLWRNGELQGKVVALDGDVAWSGPKLTAPPTMVPLIFDFLNWAPVAPRSVKQLAGTAARLCRLLRDEVSEELAANNIGLTELATEWRGLLFPSASDAEFADGYAQAVTFGLLVARARGIELTDGIDLAARELRKSNSLIATALRLLTDAEEVSKALDSALRTLTRVLDAVDWPSLTKGDVDAWLYFYEDFLEIYDKELRKKTGSYYTPPEVVNAMVRLVDEAIRDPKLFGVAQGLASHQVILADPAVGTGAYLLGALRRIAQTVEADMGAGAVPGAIAKAAERLIGFEMQFGPFAVAQLRLLAELQTLVGNDAMPTLRLFVTNTLGDPYAAETLDSNLTKAISESRRQANAIKRGEPITVVIGNPPYKEKAKGRGGWIEAGTEGKEKPMARWNPPKEWGVGAHSKHLKNLYVYFWRWATWKVFGSGLHDSTGEAESDRTGIVCYITVAGFLNGPGFQKMRADLRADCSHIWIIDCSPEGHQPDVPTRVFQGVQQPVCIVLALRPNAKDPTKPAKVHFRALPEGKRALKFEDLAKITLSDAGWVTGPSGWREPFLAKRAGVWGSFWSLSDFFDAGSAGALAGRTWVIAPDRNSLQSRWKALTSATDSEVKEDLFSPTLRNGVPADRHSNKIVKDGLAGHETRVFSVAADKGEVIPPVKYGFRTLDQQYIIPDNRLLLSARPHLWEAMSSSQIHLTALDAHAPDSGPAVSFTNCIPDQHHYKGSFGGRVFPLWKDAEAVSPNVKPELLARLALAYGNIVGPEDVMAYIAALLAHPEFTKRFAADLKRPGLRVPLTANLALFQEAAALGREVVWLHCYGERFSDPDAGRPASSPRMPAGEGPTIPAGGAIPGAPEPLPDTMTYDAASKRLHIGAGFIDNVSPAVWAYEVSGKNILRQWFSYRKRDRTRPIIGDRRPPSPLDKIQPDHWLDEYTIDLINLLHVLGRLVALEPAQTDLLTRICAGQLISSDTTEDDG